MLRFCNCLRALLRMRRSADFVLGIKSVDGAKSSFKGRNSSLMILLVNVDQRGFFFKGHGARSEDEEERWLQLGSAHVSSSSSFSSSSSLHWAILALRFDFGTPLADS